jgi:ABC-2 type transport system ATP-binding protein
MITLQEVTKRYGRLVAVDGVTLTVRPGECCVVLGPNGAGKSTIFRMISTLSAPTAGRVEVAGHDVSTAGPDVRRRLGYLPEVPPIYPEMTVATYLRFVAGCRGFRRNAVEAEHAIERCGLGDVRHRLTGNLSKGYRQRIGLAQALVGDPAVLILDEPTLGLDPPQAAEIRSLVLGLAPERTILLSTHILSEAAALGRRIVVLHRGRILADAPPDQLAPVNGGRRGFTLMLRRPSSQAADAIAAIPGVLHVAPDGDGRYLITTLAHADCREEIATVAVQNGWGLLELAPLTDSLEATFLGLVADAEHRR